MKAEDKKTIINTLDQLGRALVDMAERLEIIKLLIYSDKPPSKGGDE